MDGYKRGKPDVSWWLDEIEKGRQYRERFAYQSQWNTWRQYYRGEWRDDIQPVNLFFMMIRTIVPRTYFRNPSISVTPGKPGLLYMALAKVQERVDNKLFRFMGLKREVKKIVQNGFMFGTGFGKLGYGGLFAPTVDSGFGELPVTKRSGRVEYRQSLGDGMPWFVSTHPQDVIAPFGLDHFENARWMVHRVERPLDDVKADPRFSNTKDLKSMRPRAIATRYGRIEKGAENTVELFEVRDKKTHKVFVLAPDKGNSRGNKVIFFDDDFFMHAAGHSIFPLQFNEDDEICWGIPDSKILEPFQIEINEIRTQTVKHRRLTLVKLLVQEGGMTVEEAHKLVDESVSPVIWTKLRPDLAVKVLEGAHIPPDLILAEREVMQDVRETVGFSRNDFSQKLSGGSDRTTATEANIVRMASEIRIDERRDAVADLILDMVMGMHEIIYNIWTEDQVIDLVGPGGAKIWVEFNGELLRHGKYSVNIDPDSSLPLTRDLREAKAMQLYQVLASNPLIDPIKLTQFLLAEMQGVQFDDLMRALPEPQGGVSEGSVPVQEFARQTGEALPPGATNGPNLSVIQGGLAP